MRGDTRSRRRVTKLALCSTRVDPRWASANLGIFICLRCSGIHRSLGVHISKVRSVDLDTWTPEHIAIMQAWGGNHRANQYWEHRTPEPGAYDDARIESFIRKKYEQQKWARAESPEVFLQSVSAARGDAAVTAPSAAAPPAVEVSVCHHHALVICAHHASIPASPHANNQHRKVRIKICWIYLYHRRRRRPWCHSNHRLSPHVPRHPLKRHVALRTLGGPTLTISTLPHRRLQRHITLLSVA